VSAGHTPLPEIKPYVTAKGGVVILNGPFPLDQAERVRNFIAAAPDTAAERDALAEQVSTLREALKMYLDFLKDEEGNYPEGIPESALWDFLDTRFSPAARDALAGSAK